MNTCETIKQDFGDDLDKIEKIIEHRGCQIMVSIEAIGGTPNDRQAIVNEVRRLRSTRRYDTCVCTNSVRITPDRR